MTYRKSTGLDEGNWDKLGAHYPERETSMRLCHGIFTDQFIFRPVLARILIPYYRKLTMNVENAKKVYVTQN